MTERLACAEREDLRAMLTELVESGLPELPVLPQVAAGVISLANDTDTEISELAMLIGRDQALAAHVLRVSNSAVYGGREPVTSLEEAVAQVGTALLEEIAICVSVRNEIFRAPGFESEVEQIWQHSLAAGVWGREVGRMKGADEEAQFLFGLLHNVGKPVALQALNKHINREGMEVPRTVVMDLVQEYHCLLGKTLARRWDLPKPVSIVCGYYEEYREAPEFIRETAMTYLSGRLSMWSRSDDFLTVDDLLCEPVFSYLRFAPREIEALLDRHEAVRVAVNAMKH